MRFPRFGRLALAFVALAMMARTPAVHSADDKIAAKVVTYAELGKLVRDYKGKVVVVDFWSVY